MYSQIRIILYKKILYKIGFKIKISKQIFLLLLIFKLFSIKINVINSVYEQNFPQCFYIIIIYILHVFNHWTIGTIYFIFYVL